MQMHANVRKSMQMNEHVWKCTYIYENASQISIDLEKYHAHMSVRQHSHMYIYIYILLPNPIAY